jgi:predicted O-linked N-acetylglucosamine transferase (SPINDLY family)
MDYVLHADEMEVPGTQELFTETVLRIGPALAPYLPDAERLPPTETPALSQGCVTFGAFTNPARVNDETIAAWARILKGRPGSRLVLKYAYYADPVLQRVFVARFTAHGIDPSSIVFLGHTTGLEYLSAFGRIDLALDPSPCPGGTTTCDALANGVPVLTLRGPDFYSRLGVPALEGLPELVAESWDDYVGRAVALTADVEALNALRARVRPTFEASAVCDAPGFTRRIEQVYRDVFAAWAQATPA